VAVPPTHYMEESRRSPGTWTSRVYFSERSGAQSILGSNFMMGHEILFDAGGGRIGFSESHCDYDRLVQERQRQQTAAGLSGAEGEVAKGAAQIGVAVEEGEEAVVAVDEKQEVAAGTGVNNDLAASGEIEMFRPSICQEVFPQNTIKPTIEPDVKPRPSAALMTPPARPRPPGEGEPRRAEIVHSALSSRRLSAPPASGSVHNFWMPLSPYCANPFRLPIVAFELPATAADGRPSGVSPKPPRRAPSVRAVRIAPRDPFPGVPGSNLPLLGGRPARRRVEAPTGKKCAADALGPRRLSAPPASGSDCTLFACRLLFAVKYNLIHPHCGLLIVAYPLPAAPGRLSVAEKLRESPRRPSSPSGVLKPPRRARSTGGLPTRDVRLIPRARSRGGRVVRGRTRMLSSESAEK
ncbi:hypothetical protein THAOC_36786, partial [Thalassiosira oceanica]